jgi:hypothetical protein
MNQSEIDAVRALLGAKALPGSIVSHRRMVAEAGRPPAARTLAIGYCYLREHDIAAGHIAVGGDSAGGNLTAVLIKTRCAGRTILANWPTLVPAGMGRKIRGYQFPMPTCEACRRR